METRKDKQLKIAELPVGTERKINEYQKSKFASNRDAGKIIVDIHRPILDGCITKGGPLSVLDIGGGSGYEMMEVYAYCQSKGCEVHCTVLDTTAYDTWGGEQYKCINFVEGSAFNITELFEPHSFDLVFCNRLMHHLVFESLKQTKLGQAVFLEGMKQILKPGGTLCVTENTIESYVGNFSNNLHFYLTATQNPLLARVFRAFGAKSAGTGVYFRNERGWAKLFHDCGFQIIRQTAARGQASFPNFKQKFAKTVMLIKSHLLDIGYDLIVCEKGEKG